MRDPVPKRRDNSEPPVLNYKRVNHLIICYNRYKGGNISTIQIKIREKGSIVRKISYHNPLKRAIITTLSFFDITKYPLKQNELEKFLHRTTASRLDLSIMLKRLQGKGLIAQKDNFWFLAGRQKNVAIRKKRNTYSQKKLDFAVKYIKYLKIIPFIKSVSICNTLAYNNAKKGSDIDLFIITNPKRLWIARGLSLFLFNILGLRDKNNKNRFCFSFFTTTDNLNLKSIYLEPFDPYLPYWIATLKPVFGNKYFMKFVRQNLWYKKELPNHSFLFRSSLRKGTTYVIPGKRSAARDPHLGSGYPARSGFWNDNSELCLSGFIRFLTEKLIDFFAGNIIEKKLFKFQKRKIKELSTFDQMGIGVIVSRSIAKTHYIDQRYYFRDELDKRLKQSLRFT